MSRTRYASRLRVTLGTMTLLTLVRLRAQAAEPVPLPGARGEPPGSDVFVTVREALLRDRPSKESRFLAKLPSGSRLALVESGEAYLKVDVVAGTAPGASSDRVGDLKSKRSSASGYLSREVAAVFAPGPAATADLAAAGRALAGSEGHRRLAAAFLLRASERLRAEGPGDPAVELLLGETAVSLAAAGGPFPPGLEIAERPKMGAPIEPPRFSYTGDAFRRAVAMLGDAGGDEAVRSKERARAGLLRQQFPETASSLTLLFQETAGWLEIVESAGDPSVLRASSDRLGSSSLALARLLLASGRLDDMEKLEKRVRDAGARVASISADGGGAGRKLAARAGVVHTMRGNGNAAFPQEVKLKIGPKELAVRIEGKLGDLALVERSTVGGTRVGPLKKAAVPVLPVPGSLRISPDGRSAAWIEVVSPSKLVPVVASLERNEPAREIALLSSGRPLRDQGLAHVVSTLTGYSKDGQRLGVSIQAWNDTPGPDPRYSVVSVATGTLLFETSKDLKGFERLVQ